mmetsp:Transcript_48510/g.114547  ORF Transcript_48510/g.114547 Transcript_48510/m.114547 type:complete len:975 (+) Transcript_48510:71-2995(+)
MAARPSALTVNSSAGHPGSPHPEFKGAGSREGLLIWRIEDKVPTLWPESKHGTFHTGDSYICLKTTIPSTGYKWDIHFWLGKDSSVDEIGIAAIKTVELDDSLGGVPSQYRETQGHESRQFQSLFKKGIMYLDGGVDSGFRHVERDEYPTRLFQLKGKRNVRVTQIALTADINSGDVFILDKGLKIYQWNGKDSNKYERAKALDVVVGIKDNERQGRAEIVRVDEGDEPEEFWSAFGDKRPRVVTAEMGGDDSAVEAKAATEKKLYRVSAGNYQIVDSSGVLKFASLKSDGVFLVDCSSELFVWVGPDAPKEDRSSAMKSAMDFISKEGRKQHTPINKVLHDAEPPLFKDKFSDWPRKKVTVDWTLANRSGRTASSASEHKISELANKMDSMTPKSGGGMLRSQSVVFGDGTGDIQVWRVENFDLAPVPKAKWGQFYSGDSYLVLYEYLNHGKKAYVIYFWLGRHSTTDEIGTAAMKAKEMDDQFGGEPVQVRVTQNKEPSHFLRLFKGSFIVHDGGNPSGFKTGHPDLDHHDGTGLYHVRGHSDITTRAVQVDKEAASLNSCDAFVLRLHDTIYAWYGRKCTLDERATSKKCADILRESRKEVEVEEGNEPAEFWAELGGKKEYPEGAPDEDEAHPPRLFQCSNASGTFEVEEVVDFAQDDLSLDDTFILDDWKEVFVWVGSEANELEKRKVMELAQTYVESGGDARKGTPVMRVDAGKEPPLFTCHFLGWDHHKAQTFEDPYERKIREMREGSATATPQAANPYGAVRLKASPHTPVAGSSSTPTSATSANPFAVNLRKTPTSGEKSQRGGSAGPEPSQAPDATPPWAVRLKATGRSLEGGEEDSPIIKIDDLQAPSSPAPAIPGLQDFDSPRPSPAVSRTPVAATQSASPAAAAASPATPSADYADWRTTKFPYEDLKERSPAVEAKVDPARRANYLSDEDFQKHLGCSPDEFEAMKGWKQADVKKKAGLF